MTEVRLVGVDEGATLATDPRSAMPLSSFCTSFWMTRSSTRSLSSRVPTTRKTALVISASGWSDFSHHAITF